MAVAVGVAIMIGYLIVEEGPALIRILLGLAAAFVIVTCILMAFGFHVRPKSKYHF
jgi:hypothetical protein